MLYSDTELSTIQALRGPGLQGSQKKQNCMGDFKFEYANKVEKIAKFCKDL